jgi:carbon monoxide dehydrogenase subunit G
VRIENAFEVPAPPERAWDLLMDVPRIVPCMPGAELTDVVSDSAWKAKMNVKLGPISLTFATDVERVEADETARRAKLSARAREVRGRGGGQAMIESWLIPMDGGTRVEIVTDLTLSGPVAQYGRGMVADVSSQLVQRFADCLEAELAGPQAPEAAAGDTAAGAVPKQEPKPAAGLPLLVTALRRALARALRSLADRAEPTERSQG